MSRRRPRSRSQNLNDIFPIKRIGMQRAPLRDLYHFLMVRSWAFLLGGVVGVYFVLNMLFALLYMSAPEGSVTNTTPGFTDAFFFSVQTFSTIGYGGMAPTTLYTNILVTIEAVVGLLTTAFATGLAFAKFSRPTVRVTFTSRAVIAPYEGTPTLMIRMANERSSRINQAHLDVTLIINTVTAEGHRMRRLLKLPLIRDDTPTFFLTWTAFHPITDDSPLCDLDSDALIEGEAVLMVMLTGIDESYAQSVHARHYYLAEDILWGARFADLFSQRPDGTRVLDQRKIHDIVEGIELDI